MSAIVFSGFGAAFPRHKVTNPMLAQLARAGMFTGVSADKLRDTAEFQAWRAEHPEQDEDVAAFCFSVEGHGFHERYHLQEFPAGRRSRHPGIDVAELAARAIEEALDTARLDANDVGAWVIGSFSVHGLPGIAALVKEYLTRPGNASQVRSIHGACGGFAISLQTAREMFATQPSLKHIVVAHTDAVSPHLYNQGDYVRPALFGDGAAAIVLTRDELAEDGSGLLTSNAFQDQGFMGHIGIDMRNELYHAPQEVKKLAVQALTDSANRALADAGLDSAAVNWFVPHQTGNGIVDKTARMLKIDDARVVKDVQRDFGNISGATVPAGLWCLHRKGLLTPGMVVLGVTAGAGGEMGAFVYRVPLHAEEREKRSRLAGKRVMLTGASGEIGGAILRELQREGAQVVVVRNRNPVELNGAEELVVDLSDSASVEAALARLVADKKKFDALIHCAGAPCPVSPALSMPMADLTNTLKVNYQAPVTLTSVMAKARLIRGTVVYIGSASEDYQVAGSSVYLASKRALHGWAASASTELQRYSVDSLYVQLGVVRMGMAAVLSEAQLQAACETFRQREPMHAADVARRIVHGLCAAKVPGCYDTLENALTVRRDGYIFEAPQPDR